MNPPTEGRGLMIVVPATWNHTEDSILSDADCGCRCWATQDAVDFCEANSNIDMKCLPCAAQQLLDLMENAEAKFVMPEWCKEMFGHLPMEDIQKVMRRAAMEYVKEQS